MANNNKYEIDVHFFDEINTPEKAYWLGFIWGDGYVMSRERKGYMSYEFKLSLSEVDHCHLALFNVHTSSTYPIKNYDVTGFHTLNQESRVYVSRNDFVSVLFNKYGIVPRRDDFSRVIEHTPKEFYKFLIRGLLDSDGGITMRDVQFKKALRKEFSMHLISNTSVLNFFNDVLIEERLTTTRYKQVKRHIGRDGLVANIRITGNVIVEKILRWVYSDLEEISLERKRKQYENICQYMTEYREGKCNV
jgi:hypothetical protein